MYPLADDLLIDASPLGVRVRTVDGSGTCLLTTKQAKELAELVREWTWAGVLYGGGSVLTARACESCVVVRCSGHASAEELERFAVELVATAAQARRYVPPETGWGKKKQRAQGAR